MKYFKNCQTLEDVKKTYRALCFKYHPDLYKGDNGETMKEINAEYEKAFEMFKHKHKADNKQAAAATAAETPEMFKDIIDGLVNCDGVVIDIVGTWVWLTGNTFEYKAQIKKLGFKWANKKKAWYWHSGEYKARRSKMTLDEIKAKYGYQTLTPEQQLKLAHA